MTGLLVSVSDRSEAEAALRGGAALIDVKEPRQGSLGRATAAQWAEVAAAVAGRVPLSVACGELGEAEADPLAALPETVRFAKCGLAGCSAVKDWPQRWQGWISRLPAPVEPVAVLYADWRAAAAPRPAEVLHQALASRCRVLLCDTWAKDGRTLLDHLAPAALAPLLGAARGHGLRIVLAGSLQRRDLAEVLPLQPDYVAVRGAVCRGGRAGRVDALLVAELAGALTSAPCRAVGAARPESACLLDISRTEFDT